MTFCKDPRKYSSHQIRRIIASYETRTRNYQKCIEIFKEELLRRVNHDLLQYNMIMDPTYATVKISEKVYRKAMELKPDAHTIKSWLSYLILLGIEKYLGK